MKADIKFSCERDAQLSMANRFEVSSGVTLATGFDLYQNRQYKDHSYKPLGDWRKINREEMEILFCDNQDLDNNTLISLIEVPAKIKKLIGKISFSEVNSYREFINLFSDKSHYFADLNLELAYFLREIIQPGKPLSSSELLCFSYENPMVETIAYDQKDDRYFGLHLDCSEFAKVTGREKNRNRISINIGNEPRYLIYVNLTIKTMIEMIKIKFSGIEDIIENITDREFVILFFKYYHNYPVIRIRQDPFEAYIAPTDNIIHDGSTLGKLSPDMTMVFTGYFNAICSNL